MNLAQLKQEVNQLKASLMRQDSQHISFNQNETIIHGFDRPKIYIPTVTGAIGHSDNSFVRLIIGPYGSGKSTWCCHEIVRRACAMPVWSAGRRRSRWAIVRNTSGELQSTTLQTWLMWFGDLGDIKKRQKPLMTYEHTFNDGNGLVELELIFIALDREDDLRKIRSMEVTGCYINELSELPEGVLAHFKGRLNGRYPSSEFCKEPYWSGIIADTNPPSTDSWIYKTFEVDKPEGYKIFHQPPGLIKDKNGKWQHNQNCDNNERFKDSGYTYYTRLAAGQTEQFVNVFCLGEYGTVGFGKRVYPEFNSDIHAVDNIDAIQGEPLHIAWDFGLTPSVIVAQMSPRGQLRLLKEYIGEDIGLRTFTESIVIPGLKRDFPYCKLGSSVCDPAGAARDQILEEMSCLSELNSLGIKTEIASTNEIDSRLAAVRFFLNRMIDGKPAIVVSRNGCPVLFNAFVRDYVYKRLAVSGEERYRDKPDKNFASHISDATQYLCLTFSAECIMKEKQPKEVVSIFNPTFRWSN